MQSLSVDTIITGCHNVDDSTGCVRVVYPITLVISGRQEEVVLRCIVDTGAPMSSLFYDSLFEDDSNHATCTQAIGSEQYTSQNALCSVTINKDGGEIIVDQQCYYLFTRRRRRNNGYFSLRFVTEAETALVITIVINASLTFASGEDSGTGATIPDFRLQSTLQLNAAHESLGNHVR